MTQNPSKSLQKQSSQESVAYGEGNLPKMNARQSSHLEKENFWILFPGHILIAGLCVYTPS